MRSQNKCLTMGMSTITSPRNKGTFRLWIQNLCYKIDVPLLKKGTLQTTIKVLFNNKAKVILYQPIFFENIVYFLKSTHILYKIIIFYCDRYILPK